MSSQMLKRIAVALAGLVVLWGATELFRHRSDTTTAKFALPALTVVDVDSVKMFRPSDTVVLVKRGPGDWTVNDYQASGDVVSGLFRSLSGVSQAELIAQSATSHKQLGVDSSTGKRLEFIKGGQTLLDLVVGGRGPAFDGVYVRRPGENDVYLIKSDLGNDAERQLDDWRDKKIAEVSPDSVREVKVQLKRGGYDLKRGEKGWSFASGARADSGAVRRMLEQYRNFLAGGFPTKAQADSLDFKQPTRRLTLAGKSSPFADLLFDSTASWWWVKKTDSPVIYRLETWRMPQLFPADSTLKAKPDTAKKAKPDTTKKTKRPSTDEPGRAETSRH